MIAPFCGASNHEKGPEETRPLQALRLTAQCNLGQAPGGVADVVGIRCSAISGKLKVSDQAARSIG